MMFYNEYTEDMLGTLFQNDIKQEAKRLEEEKKKAAELAIGQKQPITTLTMSGVLEQMFGEETLTIEKLDQAFEQMSAEVRKTLQENKANEPKTQRLSRHPDPLTPSGY